MPKVHTKFENGPSTSGAKISKRQLKKRAKLAGLPGPLSLERLEQLAVVDGSDSNGQVTHTHTDQNESTLNKIESNGTTNGSLNDSERSNDINESKESIDNVTNGGMNGTNGTKKPKYKRKLGKDKVVNFYESDEEPTAPRKPIENIDKIHNSLPVYRARTQILEKILGNRVTVLLAETGSGKSTQLPQLLVNNDKKERVAITQPRRVAAINLATRVSDEMGVQIGQQVGYSVRFQNKWSPQSKIKYLTDGMLLREMLIDPDLTRYTTVILDEAHERTVLTDLLMGLIKRLLSRRQDIRVVVMSATLDAEKFASFFGAQILYVEGKMYPVERYYLKAPVDDVVDGVVQAVCQVNSGEPSGDMLVFLAGQEDIDKCVDRINAIAPQMPKEAPLMVALPLYASLPPQAQQKVFENLPARRRKIIVATNIAETSLTIPGVRYVIDSGLRKIRVWKPQLGLDTLLTTPISQASAQQRMGRAGREGPGKCFRLFPESTYTQLSSQTEPEIVRCDPASTVLMLKRAGVDDVLGFEWVESPSKKAIKAALLKLYSLKALDDSGKITDLGREMVLLPVSPTLAAVLIHAKEDEQLLRTVVDIVACLSVDDLLVTPHPDKRDEVNEKRNQLFAGGREYGDLIMLREMVALYRTIPDRRSRKEFCESVGVNWRGMDNVELVRKQLLQYTGYKSETNEEEDETKEPVSNELVVQTFIKGYVANTALGLPDRRYKTVMNGQILNIHPSSMMFGRKKEAIMYMDYVYTTKAYARMVSTVEVEWLKEIGGHLLARHSD
uniref:RNA helicase n=1 Tax=Blastobotrys adeninivorans TaxID=409370 RepID=A0A060SXA1_BLAAD